MQDSGKFAADLPEHRLGPSPYRTGPLLIDVAPPIVTGTAAWRGP
ncbi:hypothetical protein MMMDOFMJ_0087 [Methylobacterium gnaphalii]|nr:hypothetical protein MMMDOFMJ_0087 [Methylobacterium gnaphalii]